MKHQWLSTAPLFRLTDFEKLPAKVFSRGSIAIALGLLLFQGAIAPAQAKQITIVSPENASWCETVAAREVRRYLFLTTGKMLAIRSEKTFPKNGEVIVVTRKGQSLAERVAASSENKSDLTALAPQNYLLQTLNEKNRRILLLAGGDDVGTLYAAYRLAEIFGVRFYLHGDVIPDKKVSLALPQVNEKSAPLFRLRGIQPFHDFPEGPDWWNKDDYLAIVAQLPKLRMNFIGLHTYPEDHPNAEPTVWIGLPQDVDKNGGVKEQIFRPSPIFIPIGRSTNLGKKFLPMPRASSRRSTAFWVR